MLMQTPPFGMISQEIAKNHTVSVAATQITGITQDILACLLHKTNKGTKTSHSIRLVYIFCILIYTAIMIGLTAK